MIRIVLILLLIAVGVISTDRSNAQAIPPSPEKKAIEANAQAFVTAYDAGDARAVAALWTSDGEYSLGGQTVKGRAEIQKLYEEHFRANPGSKVQVKIEAVRSLAPNIVLEEGVAAVSGTATASAYSAIHTKVDGKWLMASVRESDVPLPAPPESLEKLAGLIGQWSAKGDKANVSVKFEWMHDKHFVRAETTVHPKDKSGSVAGGMQVVGIDPLTGRIISWNFTADGGHSTGVWTRRADRWLISTQGASAEGAITTATNVFYQPHSDVLSWQSVDRTIDGQPLPRTDEIVLERVVTTPSAK
jgi:uncharacterized protein (TIGR02246 family)